MLLPLSLGLSLDTDPPSLSPLSSICCYRTYCKTAASYYFYYEKEKSYSEAQKELDCLSKEPEALPDPAFALQAIPRNEGCNPTYTCCFTEHRGTFFLVNMHNIGSGCRMQASGGFCLPVLCSSETTQTAAYTSLQNSNELPFLLK